MKGVVAYVQVANEELHGARALLLGTLRKQHVGALHRQFVAVGISTHEILGFAVDVVNV